MIQILVGDDAHIVPFLIMIINPAKKNFLKFMSVFVFFLTTVRKGGETV